MFKPETNAEQLLFTTCRIEVRYNDGQIGIGTGFQFEFLGENGQKLPVILTNKHVIEGAEECIFWVHEASVVDDQQIPTGQSFSVQPREIEKAWIPHPNPDVDLCALPFNPIIMAAQEQEKHVYYIPLTEDLITTESKLKDLDAIEDVIMVGYPIGLWDEVHNFPLIRRGTTSSHPSVDFNGESIGVIDVACFPGSSGSPVLIYNMGAVPIKQKKQIQLGSRILLLGVLSSGPYYTEEGKIVVEDIPTASQPSIVTRQMINLGYYVKAQEILVLGERMRQLADKQEETLDGPSN